FRKDGVENRVGQILTDLFLPAPRFFDRDQMKAATPFAGAERIASENKEKQAECMLGRDWLVEQIGLATGKAEDFAEIDFEKVFGDGKRVLVIEPPMPTVGENAPRHLSFGNDSC